MMTDGRYRVSLPRRARIGVAAAEGLPACASGEHKAEDGDPETSEHVLMYLCAVNLEQCAAAALSTHSPRRSTN